MLLCVSVDGRVKCSIHGECLQFPVAGLQFTRWDSRALTSVEPDMVDMSVLPELERTSMEAGKNPDYCFMTRSEPGPEGDTATAVSVRASDIDTTLEEKVKTMIAVEYLGSRNSNGESMFAYVDTDGIKRLLSFAEVARVDFNPLLREVQSFEQTVKTHEVPHLGRVVFRGSSSSDTSYSGRRDFAAARLWSGQAVPPMLTVADYVERVRNQSLVRLARRTPGAWDPAADRELVRQRNL